MGTINTETVQNYNAENYMFGYLEGHKAHSEVYLKLHINLNDVLLILNRAQLRTLSIKASVILLYLSPDF